MNAFINLSSFNRNFVLNAGVLLALSVAGCGGGGSSSGGSGGNATPTPAGTPRPVAGNAIAFVSTRDGNPEIYAMRPDGSAQTRLTNNAGADGDPNQSRDGRRIVFESNRDGNSEIYLMNFDGSGVQRLTNDSGAFAPIDTQPIFSPDGSTIAWTSTRQVGTETDIWLMDSTGGNQRRLTQSATGEGAFNPVFSPDGSRLAFFAQGPRQRYRRETLAFVNLASRAVTLTGLNTNISRHPRFSPDGSKIIFSDQIPNTNPGRIQIFDVNSGAVSSGPSGGIENQNPDYSPDGRSIVWHVSTGGTNGDAPIAQIYIADTNGSGVRSLTTQGSNYSPDF